MKKYFFTKSFLPFLLSFFLFTTSLLASVKPNSLFTNNMVLQRNMPIKVYGTSTDEANITVKLFLGDDEIKSLEAEIDTDGNWKVVFPKMKASKEAHKIEIITEEKTLEITNILIGDVWIASGQSNMDLKVKHAKPLETEFKNSDYIRIIKGGRIGSPTKSTEYTTNTLFNSSWQLATKKFTSDISTVAYGFAQKIYEETDVPIGIIQSSIGGTPVRSWMPEEAYVQTDISKVTKESDPMAFTTILRYQKKKEDRKPTHYYNALIAPLTQFAIKGAIWYQGESDAGNHKYYANSLELLISSWRSVWNQGDFPFIVVQLPSFQQKGNVSNWPPLRSAQEEVVSKLKNTYLAVTIDTGDKGNIHPKSKAKVSERVALIALKLDDAKIIAEAPEFKKMKMKNLVLTVTFDNVGEGLETREVVRYVNQQKSEETITVSPEELLGFEVAGEDEVFHPATAKIISENEVKLYSDEVIDIKYIRYAYSNFPMMNLFNSAGIPAKPFHKAL